MSVQASHTLKQLETRREKLRAEHAALRTDMLEVQQSYHAAGVRLRAVEKEIADLARQSAGPVVTEHALLRYLERVKGLDLEALRQEILTEGMAQQIQALRSGRFPLQNGIALVVEDLVVRTIETTELAQERKARRKKAHTGPKPAERRHLDHDDQ